MILVLSKYIYVQDKINAINKAKYGGSPRNYKLNSIISH